MHLAIITDVMWLLRKEKGKRKELGEYIYRVGVLELLSTEDYNKTRPNFSSV